MIRSMTGYGKAMLETTGIKITVEVRSLNSKQADISTRLPWIYKEKEIEIRNMVIRRLQRGKIDLNVSFDTLSEEPAPVLNKSIIRSYFSQLKEITGELGTEQDQNLLAIVMRLPETIKSEKPELTEEEWGSASRLIEEALTLTDQYRIEEGKSIENDLTGSVNKITDYLEHISKLEPERMTRTKDKLNSLLKEGVGTENIDKNRFEQELIYYLEKMDINEEKVRLRQHCDYFTETLKGSGSNGKMLSFIAQEMGREINTIGSKANDAAIQKMVVMMKDELERIKEQALNVL